MGSLRKWLMKILMFLVVAAAAILILDWLVGRVIQWRTSGERVSQYWRMSILAEPYVMTKLGSKQPRLEGITFNINKQGFRHNGPVLPEKSRPRIFFIGGSVAMGVGASADDTTYAGCIQRRFPDIEFVNAGGPSYIAKQQWIHLALNLLPLKPDGIVILDGFNDMAIPVAYGDRPGYPYLWDTYSGLLSGNLFRTLWAHLRMKSNINRVISRIRTCNYANSPAFEKDVLPKVLDQYVRATAMTYELCRSRGIRVWHVLQPQLATKKSRTAVEEKYMYGPFTEAMAKHYPRLIEKAAASSAAEKIPFLDMSGAIADVEESIFVDFCHLNDRGQELMADEMGEFLEKNGLGELSRPGQR